LLVCNLEVSLTSCGLPNLAIIPPVIIAIANLVKWKAPNPISNKYVAFAKNLGFISIDEAELPTILNAVIMFYL